MARLRGTDGNDLLEGRGANDEISGGFGNDTLRGNGGDDGLQGDEGHDQLFGGAGDDWFSPWAGNDLVDGGDGFDTVYFNTSLGPRRIDLRLTSRQDTGEGFDRFINIERISVSVGTHALTAQGSERDEGLMGGWGNDTLISGGGNDYIYGYGGDDLIQGSLERAASFRRIAYYGGEGQDTLVMSDGNDRYEFYERDISIDGFEVIDGGRGHDLLGFEQPGLLLKGGSGADRLMAGADGQVLDGGSGRDLLLLDDGGRVNLALTGAQEIEGHRVTLRRIEGAQGADGKDTLLGSAGENQLLGDAGDDVLVGRDGDDRLSGGLGADRLQGGAGDDRLEGGQGNDRLSGGAGADLFQFGPREQRDVITDFDTDEDRLVFTGSERTFDRAIDTARVINGNLVMEFRPGDRVILQGVDDISGIEDWFTLGL